MKCEPRIVSSNIRKFLVRMVDLYSDSAEAQEGLGPLVLILVLCYYCGSYRMPVLKIIGGLILT